MKGGRYPLLYTFERKWPPAETQDIPAGWSMADALLVVNVSETPRGDTLEYGLQSIDGRTGGEMPRDSIFLAWVAMARWLAKTLPEGPRQTVCSRIEMAVERAEHRATSTPSGRPTLRGPRPVTVSPRRVVPVASREVQDPAATPTPVSPLSIIPSSPVTDSPAKAQAKRDAQKRASLAQWYGTDVPDSEQLADRLNKIFALAPPVESDEITTDISAVPNTLRRSTEDDDNGG